ncbi:FtsQ-type POTRA domain-containing protein [Tsukamurella sp. 8F]|uniref:cell division protein FtsQ/DivIB n=1 Tax=unclassified Tsukamurella TaxID=2633480 RepID=UPI0023B8F34C|nr:MULTISPECIES: FtsQ-type POTRA domain-containing protein [unclassified Tsukamurella]MDF0532465.1 FtsQ-type POTRA domain-containing protein [Tsukamurella sp. 8J]MDF0588448.1 FtsQ-type POTRA domain-containing protein [Tsukamurella sp. 8F]
MSSRVEGSRRRIPGLLPLLVAFGAVAVLVGIVAALYFSPLLSVRSVEVTGATNAPQDRVAAAVDGLKGRPLMQLQRSERDAAAVRVAEVSPWIDSATVTVKYPSSVVVHVVEREVVAYASIRGATALVDAKGTPFLQVAKPPSFTPRLTTSNPSSGDADTRAALAVLTSLPADLRGQVKEIGAESPAAVRIVLHDKRIVLWGDDTLTGEKATALRTVLTRPGHEYTVVNPAVPTAK